MTRIMEPVLHHACRSAALATVGALIVQAALLSETQAQSPLRVGAGTETFLPMAFFLVALATLGYLAGVEASDAGSHLPRPLAWFHKHLASFWHLALALCVGEGILIHALRAFRYKPDPLSDAINSAHILHLVLTFVVITGLGLLAGLERGEKQRAQATTPSPHTAPPASSPPPAKQDRPPRGHTGSPSHARHRGKARR